MLRKIVAAGVAAVLLSSCYHVTVVTGAPVSATVIDKPWQLSFIYGLIPPPELNVKDQCPQGVGKVETEHSFLNALVGAITWSIVTPIHTRVSCASGPVGR
jgi:Bor protein